MPQGQPMQSGPGIPPAGPIGFMQAEPPQNDMPLGMGSDQMQANQMPQGGDNPQEEMAEQMQMMGQQGQPQGQPPMDPQKMALIQALMRRQMMAGRR
jgi:hypothetical protein